MQKQNKDVYFQSDTSLPSPVSKPSEFSFSLCKAGSPEFPGQHVLMGHILREEQEFQNSDPITWQGEKQVKLQKNLLPTRLDFKGIWGREQSLPI